MNLEKQSPEDQLQQLALQTLERLSEFGSNTTQTYSKQIISLQKERRDLLVYLGSIAGGAAALAPQFFGHVINQSYFYIGVLLLALDVVVALSYVLGHVEIDVNRMGRDQKFHFNRIENMRKPLIIFLKGKDHSPQAYAAAQQEYVRAFGLYQKCLGEVQTNNEKRYLYKAFPSIKPLNYISEFQIWFFVLGIGLLTLSTLSFAVSVELLVLCALVLLAAITLIMRYPDRIFVWLGFPIDLCKSYFTKKPDQAISN